MIQNTTITKLLLLLMLTLPLVCLAQSNKEFIFGKRWYAIKAFYGAPGDTKSTDFICEETTLINNEAYLFYIEVKSSGRIQTNHKFNFKTPFDFRIENRKLSMYFSVEKDDKIQFDIKNVSDDFLQIEGPNKEMYFLISDNKRK